MQKSCPFFGTLAVVLLIGFFAGSCAGPSQSTTPTPDFKVGQHPYAAEIRILGEDHPTQTITIPFLLYLPAEYGKYPARKWPLILFLHGSGERGDDLKLLESQALPGILAQKEDFPAIVVSPQLPLEMSSWSEWITPLNGLLDQLADQYSVEAQRLYLTGISMGGFGTWEFALRYPQRFAALAPIVGGYGDTSNAVPENICILKDTPIWVFHGKQDSVVPVKRSEVLVEALQRCGSDVRLTIYPDAGHASTWIKAYADPALFEWLWLQQLNGDD